LRGNISSTKLSKPSLTHIIAIETPDTVPQLGVMLELIKND
jgi:hypothetical protein